MPAQRRRPKRTPQPDTEGQDPVTEKTAAPAQLPARTTMTQLPHRDDIDVAETYADGCHLMAFDGAVLRIELSVKRLIKAAEGPSAYTRTAARLVLPRSAITDLHGQLSRIVEAMNRQDVAAAKVAAADETPIRLPKGQKPN